MTRLPTNLEILNAIYERYYSDFASYSAQASDRASKIMIPIDIASIADDLGVDGDIVFGRLYYDLERKYGYQHDDGSFVALFALEAGGDRHCVNFPYIASVLASLRDENRRFRLATRLAIGSLVIALVSLVVSFVF